MSEHAALEESDVPGRLKNPRYFELVRRGPVPACAVRNSPAGVATAGAGHHGGLEEGESAGGDDAHLSGVRHGALGFGG